MSDKKEYVSYVMLAGAPIIFMNLLKKSNRPGMREQWDATLLLDVDHPDLAPIKKLSVAEFKKVAPDIDVKNKDNWKQPWQSGEEYIAEQKVKGKDKYDNSFMQGKVLLKVHTHTREPQLAVQLNGDVIPFVGGDRPRAEPYFYLGVEAAAEFTLSAYPATPLIKPGVTLYLNSIMSLNKGERRGERKDTTETFSHFKGRVSGENPTVSGDDIDY